MTLHFALCYLWLTTDLAGCGQMTDAVRAELDAEEDDGEAEASANDGAFWMSFEVWALERA